MPSPDHMGVQWRRLFVRTLPPVAAPQRAKKLNHVDCEVRCPAA